MPNRRPHLQLTLATVALALLFTTIARAQHPDSAPGSRIARAIALYNEAATAERRGDARKARATYGAVLEIDSNHIPALFGRGHLAVEAGDSVSGMRDLRRAVALGDPMSRSYLGLPAPVATFDTTPEFRANMARGELLKRAADAQNAKDLRTARARYDSLARLYPDFIPGVVLYSRGHVAYELGDTAAGLSDLRRAAALGDRTAKYFLEDYLPSIARAQADEKTRRAREVALRRPATLAEVAPALIDRARETIATRAFQYAAAAVLLVMILLALWVRLTPESQIVEFPLERGERQLWVGTPRRGHYFTLLDIPVTIGAIVWCTIVFSVLRSILSFTLTGRIEPFEIVVSLFFIPFAAYGLYLLFFRFFTAARQRKMTTYALTTRRAIVNVGTRTATFTLDDLRDAELTAYRDGTGTIKFNYPRPISDLDAEALLAQMRQGGPQGPTVGEVFKGGALFGAPAPTGSTLPRRRGGPNGIFERIQQPRGVLDLIQKTIADADRERSAAPPVSAL